eukprot:TRINITY_DN5552_c0_g3_i1.p1 TRINITY_DN5552_c0_g3~~TRINITY_DN5552_c0_g3_i1.p1  ORF type:complete len:302 (-),score=49.36 TRINITY_DN5552_c0_g3_i1:24-929(-)
MCWQQIIINVIPQTTSTGPTCNLDNTFNFSMSVVCRATSFNCSSLFLEKFNFSAIIRTENFCPAVFFRFQLAGTVTTWTQGFTAPSTIFTAYRLVKGDIPEGASKICVKATGMIDGTESSQGQFLSAAFFKSLIISDGATDVVLYSDQLGRCPSFSHNECDTTGTIALEIETADDPNLFPTLAANEAGACFYLSLDDDPTSGPQGLLDNLIFNNNGRDLLVKANIGVLYGNTKRAIAKEEQTASSQNSLKATILETSTGPEPSEVPTLSTFTVPTTSAGQTWGFSGFKVLMLVAFLILFGF